MSDVKTMTQTKTGAVGTGTEKPILEVRKLVRRSVECNRKTSGRVVVAKEDIGCGNTASLSAVPSLDEGVVLALNVAKCDCASGYVDQDNGLACCVKRCKEILLNLRKLDT